MKLARSAAIGVAALGMASLQVAFGAAAQADDFGKLTLQPWATDAARPTVVVAPGNQEVLAVWVNGPAGAKVDSNVLVTAQKVGGGSLAGVTLSSPDGCTPAVPGTPAAEVTALICDMTKTAGATMPPAPPGSPVAARHDVAIAFAAGAPDAEQVKVTQTLVPSTDTTLAQVEADQKAGKSFQSSSLSYELETAARAAQGKETLSLSDFAAGQSAVQTIMVHAADNPDLMIRSDDAVPGETWGASSKEQISLPAGLDMTGITADNGAKCQAVEPSGQHVPPNDERFLALCQLAPGDTTLKLTFKADAALKTTKVKLSAEYNVYSADGFHKPVSTGTGTFTVQAAAASAAPQSAAPVASASASAVAAATPSASAGHTATGGAELASTGAGNTMGYAAGGAAVLAVGVGVLVALRRKGARA
ncbi:hypothetical protein [Kitasatospora azatica]|uniref:hypothetical protein n=1 Tax=Kitasatospora azatica TaxID=58347 RepID=UPI0005614FC9|nr:hypothetical protein [Kitasatospora azatica]